MPLFVAPPLTHLPYVTGRPYSTFQGFSASSAVGAIDTIYLYPFPVYAPITVTSLEMRVVVLGALSSVKLAIYANSTVSQRPLGAPVIVDNTGVTTQASNTTVTANTTDTLLPIGWYWAASKFTGTLPQVISMAAGTLWHPFQTGNAGAALVVTGITTPDTYSNNYPTLAEGASFSSNTATVPILGFTL